MNIFLGQEHETRQNVWVPSHSFGTHWHIIGGTGKGKTTAIETVLHQILLDVCFASHFIFDRMGNFSQSLLLWIASPYCPQWVRDRVIYIDASREDIVPTFNPLLFDTPAHGYFKTQRAGECILRAWAAQNIEEMPRLARWTFNAMWAAAQLGLTVADCAHLLMPGSPYHEPILNQLPDLLRAEWSEILCARSGEASRILESSRNRLKPFFENPILRSMFGSRENRLDMLRFMREGKIVIINLSPQNRLSPQLADAIGGMILNEILATARSLPLGVRFPTYLWLDEFQRFVGPDIEDAIPEVRQLGIRLILSHQSFSQLKQGDTDITSLIWQAQSRMMFGVQGEDADLLAHEVASLTFDPEKIKDQMFTRRQLLKEQRIIPLVAWSESHSEVENWNKTFGTNWSSQVSQTSSSGWNDARSATESVASREGVPNDLRTRSEGHTTGMNGNRSDGTSSGEGGSESSTRGGSQTASVGRNISEAILPIHEEFRELIRKTYFTFEEQRALWAKDVRHLATGQALVRLVNDPNLYRVDVQRHAPGYLEWDLGTILRRRPQAVEAVEAFIEHNCASDVFVSPQLIERETEERLQRLLHPRIEVRSNGRSHTSVENTETATPLL